MIETLKTQAEIRASQAEELPAFSGLKLLHIKRQLEIVLGLIGRDGIFDQYTRHDVSHIDVMLGNLEWIIPETTKNVMSSADWIMTVLAIYFHDLGMLVTREEYNNRSSSGFPEFCDKVLFAGDIGADYRAKIERLPPEERDRFLYQEYVRQNHAQRIRHWIVGQAPQHLGMSHVAMGEVDALLKPLSEQFRRDLALVCESHHLDDLYDYSKYKVSQPFGNSDAETANVHYAAVLLRTADLLHMTSDRTPSIIFRTINPTDPLSQQEWAKQMAVTRVRPQVGRDKEGNPDPNAPKDTIEVHAYFKDENGFFGLTSYLAYVVGQLQKSFDWVENAARLKGSRHKFPWRYIDDSGIETVGFLRDTYEFTIDQARILDLLTGHTLYNDTRVVLRELVQNSLDAVRLQALQDHQTGAAGVPGKVRIHWNSAERALTVEDNGTGMTQDIIERHLLKVGASRYQDPEFKKQFPQFTAISRFGIGVLSAFMVADTVEITSCHPDDSEARQLSLRSVHGKYLIRLLDKKVDRDLKGLVPHGTRVKLTLRPSAKMPDPIETAKLWIVVPKCNVTVEIDNGPPVRIGFDSPRDALTEVLNQIGLRVDTGEVAAGKPRYRIEQLETHGVTLAFAVEWSEYFREWNFVVPPRPGREYQYYEDDDEDEEERPDLRLGSCIGGVRVEMETPGFKGFPILAIANASGDGAPRTNVARSGIEFTPERTAMLRAIYSLYCAHIKSEVEKLHIERSFSLTWAAQESRYLLYPLLSERRESSFEPLDSELFTEEIGRLPLVVVEYKGERTVVSLADLRSATSFWTIDAAFFHSAEMLIREVQGPVSISALRTALGTHDLHLPDGPVICGELPRGKIEGHVFAAKEVVQIVVYSDQRRADFRWAAASSPSRWIDLTRLRPWQEVDDEMDYFRQSYRTRRGPQVMVARGAIEVSGLRDEAGVQGLGTIFLLPHTPLARFLVRACDEAERRPLDEHQTAVTGFLATSLSFLLTLGTRVSTDLHDRLEEVRDRGLSPATSRLLKDSDLASLEEAIRATPWNFFRPSAWARTAT